MSRRKVDCMLLCACVVGGATSSACGADAVWIGPESGHWSVPANWSGGAVPNNGTPSNVRYNVFIDAGAAQSSHVDIPASSSFTIDDLSISSGDSLAHQGNGSLTVTGALANAGTLRVLGELGPTEMRLTRSTFSITGAGVIRLSGQARLVSTGSGRITNLDNTIRGAGTLSLAPWTNGAAASINADVPGGLLAIQTGSFTNDGVLRASGGGALLLRGPFLNNNIIEALDGSQVRLDDSTQITGGTLATAGNGVLRNALGQTSFNSVTLRDLTNRGNFVGDNATNTFLLGTMTNVGSINIISSGVSTGLRVHSGTVTLNGAGTVNLTGDRAVIDGTGTVLTDNWIRGQGTFNWGSLAVVNQPGGVIETDVPGATLTLRPRDANIPGFINHGTLRATNGGLLILATTPGTGGFSGNGAIIADTGSTVHASHASISAGPISGGGTFHYSGVGTVTAQHVRTANLLVTNLATLRIRSGGGIDGVSRVTNLTIAPQNGQLDLTNNHMVVDYDSSSPAAALRDLLRIGYANGAWTGRGIITSHGGAGGFAIGIAEASNVYSSFPAMFFGQSVDDTSVLLRFTRTGDANLDGIVNLADFNRLAANFGSTTAIWSQGDFNYDGIVNLSDFNRLAANFGLSASGPEVTPEDWSTLASAVPEPAGGLALVGLALVLSRTRRRRENAAQRFRSGA